ncbi:MAG TPA: DMT family transporter [Nitrospira sp.]|nr:DMT family transporter [Nitrospira sp.]
MSNLPGASINTSTKATHIVPLACLLGVVLLASSVTLVVKYVFQHSGVQPIALAWIRVMIGFLVLFAITLLWDRRGLLSLNKADVLQLSLVGFLGVFSFAMAAWGLMYTSVTHFALIYGLLPSCTAMLSLLMGKDRMSLVKIAGIVLSLIGCGVAVYYGASNVEADFQFGDLFVLLFTMMMSAHIVLSSGIVKRFGVMVSNTVMFGSSSLLLFLVWLEWSEPMHEEVSPFIMASIIYTGCATAAVFLLRYRSLQSLSPATVGTYHNLIPVCTVLLAYLYLGEPIGMQTILGGAMVVAGAELVRRANGLSWGSGLFWARLRLNRLTPHEPTN